MTLGLMRLPIFCSGNSQVRGQLRCRSVNGAVGVSRSPTGKYAYMYIYRDVKIHIHIHIHIQMHIHIHMHIHIRIHVQPYI